VLRIDRVRNCLDARLLLRLSIRLRPFLIVYEGFARFIEKDVSFVAVVGPERVVLADPFLRSCLDPCSGEKNPPAPCFISGAPLNRGGSYELGDYRAQVQ